MTAKAEIKAMYPVKSSQIGKIGYDPKTFYLAVEFKNLAVYGYKNVEPETFARLMNAESIGVYFTDFVKDHHETEKLRPAPKKSADSAVKKSAKKKK